MLILILLAVAFLPFAVGQVVEKAEPDKVKGYEIKIVGVLAEEQARINKIYPVSEDGFIEVGKMGEVKVKGEPAWSVVRGLRDACLKAKISEETMLLMKPIAGSGSNEESWFLIGGQENEAERRNRAWQEDLTLYAALSKAGVVKFVKGIRWLKLYRNGQVYVYDLKNDRDKAVKIFSGDVIEVFGTKSKEPEKVGAPLPTTAGQILEWADFSGSGAEMHSNTPKVTLEQAVENAGGEARFGEISRVKLYRNGQVYTYNLMIERHGNVKVYPADLIEVLGAKPKKTEK